MQLFPELVSKLDEFVVAELERKRRLYALSYRILIGCCIDKERRAALILQKAWAQFSALQAKLHSQFSASTLEERKEQARSMHKMGKRSKPPPLNLSATGGGDSSANGQLRGTLEVQLKEMAASIAQIKRMLETPPQPQQLTKGGGGKTSGKLTPKNSWDA